MAIPAAKWKPCVFNENFRCIPLPLLFLPTESSGDTIAKDSKGRSHQAFVASRLPMQFKAHMVNHAIYYLIIRNHQSVQETTTIRFWFKQPYNYCFTNKSIPTTYYDPLSTYLTVLAHEFSHMVATYYV